MNRRRMLLGSLLMRFYIMQKGNVYRFFFEKGMTWEEFIGSEYNDGSFSVEEEEIVFIGGTIPEILPSDVIEAERSYESIIKLIVYEQGKGALTNGSFSGRNNANFYPSWTGDSYSFSIASESAGEGTYHAGYAKISGIDFSEYSTLHFDGYVDTYFSSANIRVGYGNEAEGYDSSTWEARRSIKEAGAFSEDMDISSRSGEVDILLLADGATTSGKYASMYVYNIRLE